MISTSVVAWRCTGLTPVNLFSLHHSGSNSILTVILIRSSYVVVFSTTTLVSRKSNLMTSLSWWDSCTLYCATSLYLSSKLSPIQINLTSSCSSRHGWELFEDRRHHPPDTSVSFFYTDVDSRKIFVTTLKRSPTKRSYTFFHLISATLKASVFVTIRLSSNPSLRSKYTSLHNFASTIFARSHVVSNDKWKTTPPKMNSTFGHVIPSSQWISNNEIITSTCKVNRNNWMISLTDDIYNELHISCVLTSARQSGSVSNHLRMFK